MLLPVQKGELNVAGYDTHDSSVVGNVRKKCAMVFQNPDSQFVSSVVKEDIAFGLKNFNMEYSRESISNALSAVGLEGFEERSIQTLSGGQKQRLALAGVLALKPSIIILDEATTMLPPLAREQMLCAIRDIHKNTDTTIIMITQYADEAVTADRVVVMDKGRILKSDSSERIFCDREFLQSAGLEQPFVTRLYLDLKANGIDIGFFPKTAKELVNGLCQ